MDDTTTVWIQVGSEEEQIELPVSTLDLIGGQGDTPAQTAGDLVMFGSMQRLHGVVHHSNEEPSADAVAAEEAMQDLFEDRFGTSFASLIGHEH